MLGTYLGGSLLAIAVATVVVVCYFSFCDKDMDEDEKPDQVLANHYEDDAPGVSGVRDGGTAAGKDVRNGGFEMESRESSVEVKNRSSKTSS